jgi:hypothetical protein
MSSTNDNNSYLGHLAETGMETDIAQMMDSGNAGAGTGAGTTSAGIAAGTSTTGTAFHHTTMEDGPGHNNHNDRIMPPPSLPKIEEMIRGLRQELDDVMQVNKIETDRMFDEMVTFLQDSNTIFTDTMMGHLDFENDEANRLDGMEPDVDAATISLVGNNY